MKSRPLLFDRPALLNVLPVYLPHVNGGQTEPVQLASVCADGQSLLSWTHTHGDNLLALSRRQHLTVRVGGDLAQGIIHTQSLMFALC